jgi:hypothetical protein
VSAVGFVFDWVGKILIGAAPESQISQETDLGETDIVGVSGSVQADQDAIDHLGDGEVQSYEDHAAGGERRTDGDQARGAVGGDF